MVNRIKHFRKLRGLSMEGLADLAGTTAPTINKLEKGQMSLTQEWIVAIARALDVGPAELLGSPYHGFSENAETYIPPPGHYLSASPHFAYFRIKTSDLDQHPAGIAKGNLLVFDLNRADPATIKAGEIVAVSKFDRADLTKTHGILIAVFMPPNKLCSNARGQNWMLSIDDPDEAYEYVIRGTFVSVVAERS